MSKQTIIIPDVHGRKFWKDAVKKYPEADVIFLGDYLDPYESYDGISKEEAFINFDEILVFAEKYANITLLIGNHDWHYFVDLDSCRMDRLRASNIEHMFREGISKNLFSIVRIKEIANKKYIFTHAGITENWLGDVASMAEGEVKRWNPGNVKPEEDERYQWIKGISEIDKTRDFLLFNECLKHYDETFYSCIPSMVSRERGGWYPHGSLIWADVHEHLHDVKTKDDEYQIFGHTITYPEGPKTYEVNKDWAMLDASRAFLLDEEGKISEI